MCLCVCVSDVSVCLVSLCLVHTVATLIVTVLIHMLPVTFQNVSLSTHVNSHSVVLSGLAVFSPVHIHKGSGSCEHMSVNQACNPLTQRTTLRVCPVLSCPLWPCDHRMCVFAKRRSSLQRLAHATGHGHFSGASTSGRSVPLV